MKKILELCLAACFVAPIFVSCKTPASKTVVANEVDSINYALGAANAGGVRQYVIGEDTADVEGVKDFSKGFEMTFAAMKGADRVENEGLRLGWSLKQEFSKGFLFNDSTITAKEDLIIERLEAALKGENWVMTTQECETYFQTVLQPSMQARVPANLNEGQIDTINMAIGLLNADMARKFMLVNDTTPKDIKAFMKGFNAGVKSTDENRMKMEGMRIGAGMYGQLKTSDYIMNDSSILANLELVKRGFVEVINGDSNALMTSAEAGEFLNAIMAAKAAAKAAAETAEGDAFLAENAKKDGVITTASGLQYEVITMGNGAKPTATDKVKVHYHGTFVNGEVFDSSVERGEPIEFGLNQVIKGWTEGVQLMPVGSKFRFYIPYNLAYGEQGRGGIPPYSTLIFDIELFDIVK